MKKKSIKIPKRRRKVTTSDSLAKGVTESIPAKHELRNRPSDLKLGKCSNCGHEIWIAGNQVGHKGNSTGDMCFEKGCTCNNPMILKSYDALWTHWHDHFQKKITEHENKIKDFIKVLEKTTSRNEDKVVIDLSHLREYIKKHFPEFSKKDTSKQKEG